MCILFIAINQHPEYPLIVCANRDEFHQRPTQAMHWWENESLFAGKDLQAGGTWFGVNANKKFAALTNYRLPNKFDNNKKSRGELVINALTQTQDFFQTELLTTSIQYNDFNLLSGDENKLECFDSTTQKFTQLTKGVFSLCNGALNDVWPKMKKGKERLEKLVNTHIDIGINDLFGLMQDQTKTNKKHLPNTGIPTDWEQLLSSIFIISPDYGTRSTTLLLKNNVGHCQIVERSYDHNGKINGQVELTL